MNQIKLPNPKRFEIKSQKNWKDLLVQAKSALTAHNADKEVTEEEAANQASYAAQMHLDHPYDEIMEMINPLFEQVSMSQRFAGFKPDGTTPEYVEYLLDIIVFPDQLTDKNTAEEIISKFDRALEQFNGVITQAGFDMKSL